MKVTANRNLYINNSPCSFKGVIPVRYVVVNGEVTTDKKVFDKVISLFLKKIRECSQDVEKFQKVIKDATKDESLSGTGYFTKKVGKFIVTGRDAQSLKNIWQKKGDSKETKSLIVSNFLKNVFSCRMANNRLSIHANSVDGSSKIKYILTNVFEVI